MKNDAAFQYFETKDRALTVPYFQLRRRVYIEEYPWLPADFGYEEATDHISHIVLATQSGRVAGGGRLTISQPECPRSMPLEEAGFRLGTAGFLREFELWRHPYGEISRMAADPECARGFEISRGLLNELCATAASEGLDVVFGICPAKPARINDINAKKIGVRFHRYYEMSTVFGVNMQLCAFSGLQTVYRHAGREVA